MRLLALKTGVLAILALSLLWLIGYTRVIWPFALDHLRDGNFSFLSYPSIKIYRVADAANNSISPRQIDFFSTADGPTGIEYNEAYFPCWIVSLVALVGLTVGFHTLISDTTHRNRER